ncbi:MAG: hypothetical protein WCH52_08155 [Bacteroidota bacterium]
MNRSVFICLIFICAYAVSISSCKKESFITSPEATLSTSADTIKFDTVFTSVGSITQSFKIFNTNNQKLLLSSIKLMGGNNSFYKININGIPSAQLNDIEIEANDSIYVFVSVNIDPNSAQLPFIIADSILIQYNSNERFVQLQSYGQNAHFLNNKTIIRPTTWLNDLPYVILGGLRVDSTATLNIEAGCKIYAHANAPVLIDGTLIINGIKNNEVRFAGDRLDEYYRDLPASWPGIYFRSSSKDNVLSFAIIKNANQGIVVIDPSINNLPKLTIHQCIIDNAFDAGFFSTNSYVKADNTLISNCGSNIKIESGGDYFFTNCTIAAYSNLFFLHNKPVLQATNYSYGSGSLVTENMNATFQNCIFWGDGGGIDDEIAIGKEGSNAFSFNIDHCLYKALISPSNATLISNITNEDPVFDSIDIAHNYYDFRTIKASTAPGIDNGINTAFPKDLDDSIRMRGLFTDIGCYEKQ